jgi:hypothetical protein
LTGLKFENVKFAYSDISIGLSNTTNRNINDKKIEEIAQNLGLDMPQFQKSIKDQAIMQLVRDDMQEGVRIGIRGVPSVYINGKKFKGRRLRDFQVAIDKELKNKIVITPEDISVYYEENFKGKQQASELNEDSGDINEVIIKILRRKKLEEAYSSWINELKSKYKIEINNAQWEKISKSNKISEKDLELDVPPNQIQ